jgi:hypothetical protein
MKKLEMVKTVGGIVTSIGVGTIIANVIKATTPRSTRGISKLLIWAGGLALGGMISDLAGDYAEKQIQSTVENINKMFAVEEIEVKQDLD